MKKILAFNGSPHSNGNTAIALKTVLSKLESRGIETELIQIGGTAIKSCKGCRLCIKLKNQKCAVESDALNQYLEAITRADGILIGSPVYTSNVTAETKAFMDRVNFVAKANDFMLKGKIGAPVVVATKTGANFAYAAIQFMFGISQMISVGSSYWNTAFGKSAGDILKDDEGMESFEVLGDNIADLLTRL